jgi:hypothetical protein
MAMTLSLVYCLVKIVRREPMSPLLWIGFAAAIYVNATSYSRVLVVAAIVAIPLYLLLKNSRGGFLVLVSLVPVVAVILLILAVANAELVTNYLARDGSAQVRAQGFNMVLREIPAHPFFGYGKDSYNTLLYEQIFFTHFAPSDLGIVGTTFRYGVLGVAIYAGLALTCVFSMRWLRSSDLPMAKSSFVASLTFMALVMLVASISFVPFIDEDGITVCAMCLGFALIGREQMRRRRMAAARGEPWRHIGA